MSKHDFQAAIVDLRHLVENFDFESSVFAPFGRVPLLNMLLTRVRRALTEGAPILAAECHRRPLTMPLRHNQWTDSALLQALEIDLAREENVILRWVLISTWVALCNFDGVDSNVEALMESNVDNWSWLVAGALWIQSASGQLMSYDLRQALMRVRTRYPAFDEQLAAALAGPPSPIRDAADLAERLLADPSATLPTYPL